MAARLRLTVFHPFYEQLRATTDDCRRANDSRAGSDVEEVCARRLRAQRVQAEPHQCRGGYTHRNANGQAQAAWRTTAYTLTQIGLTGSRANPVAPHHKIVDVGEIFRRDSGGLGVAHFLQGAYGTDR